MQKTSYSTGILQYIPFFYVIWADDLLSFSEVSVVTKSIEEDTSLSTDDKIILKAWLNKEQPPSNLEIKNWRQTISQAHIKLVESETYPLANFSQKVVCAYKEVCPFNTHLKEIEVNLGIQPNHYNHLFNVDVAQMKTSNYYDANVIDIIFKGEYAPEIDAFRSFTGDAIFNWEINRDKSVYREKILEQLKSLAQKGYGAMAYPKEYGGTDNINIYGAIFENLIYVDGSLAVKFGVQFGLFGGSIQKLGTKAHHDKYLKSAADAKLLGCFAMTETRHGSNVRGIKTTATYDKETDSLIINTPGINDNKEYIGNALHSTIASVFAQLIVDGKNHGVHAVLVPLRNKKHQLLPGITIEDNGYKLGLNGVDNGKIWFRQVSVPRENLLNKYGEIRDDGSYFSNIKNPNKRFFTMLGTLVGGRICVAKGALSGAKMSLAIAVNYALERRQFNDSIKVQEDLIMDYPSHQLRLTPAIASCYVYQVALDQLMEDYSNDTNSDKRKIETQVAGLKSVITNFSNATIQECREACGGKGYLLENRIADLKGDVDIFTTFEGDNTVLMQLAAKGILSDFKSEFNSAGFASVLKLVGTQLSDKLTAINPLYSNKIDKDHLYNPKFHQHAFDYRTRRLTYTLAMRIRGYIKKGIPSYQSFLKVQTHLLALAHAYSIELAYKKFCDFSKTIEDEKHRLLFQKVGALYALSEIRSDAKWYLEHGYIGGTKSKAIRQRVERLCSELRPHIKVLVEGFGIPQELLTAPISN
ncbi:acyl-CoA dehydrogenase [Muriicola sp. Z0-33]|uniref:acyl-CoA dehydrogenase family protein n=1 Tax=Muriicola sp. Z0-33 TaxID=2816957 RepID=UPI002238C313|nr:acyl-CoA dehydrogenase [Muriicola sp. Z0-33]MCW5516255.1 acyl-CoA dehydrogenase family protein [Muriicola sp. Z0-33]